VVDDPAVRAVQVRARRFRTQCKIKNVFYGNIKNLLKTAYKFFTLRTAPFINSIPTDYLQLIYDASLGTPAPTQTFTPCRTPASESAP
jgi:hypothetical protein